MKKIKRNILLTPGPITTSDTVKSSQVVADVCPREEEFTRIMDIIRKDLVKIAKGDSDYTSVLIFGSGTAAMDSVINSSVPPGKTIAIVINGAYGLRMAQIAAAYKIPFIDINFEWGEKINVEKVEEKLSNNKNIACLAMVHHETTTGILNPIKEIGKIAEENNAIFIVDTISSFAGIPICIKEHNIGFMMATSNKCIQSIPGISFVICKKSELEKIKGYPQRSFYLNLYNQYRYFQDNGQMQFTAPVQAAYALQQAIIEYFEEGEENRRARYTKNWKVLRKGLLNLGFKLLLEENIESRLLLTVLEPEDPNYDFKKMHDLLYERGFTIYPGKLGKRKTFRIANIGDIDYHDIENFLKTLKEVLHELKLKLD